MGYDDRDYYRAEDSFQGGQTRLPSFRFNQQSIIYSLIVINVAIFLLDAFTPGTCLLYTSPSPRDLSTSRMPSSA